MALKVTTHIVASERLRNTTNGNPRFRITFGDGVIRTSQSDSAWTYTFGNPGMREGDKVTLTLSRTGRIEHMEPAES
jgi:hypothetical protein